jgi:hypothetical protein
MAETKAGGYGNVDNYFIDGAANDADRRITA